MVTVQVATKDGTASASDYGAFSGPITFNPGDTSVTFSITVSADTVAESNEGFAILLSNPVNATIGRSTAYGIIRDDDTAPIVTAISARGYNTCVVNDTSGVGCWGQDFGLPVSQTGLAGLTSGVASISAGVEHRCVVTTAGGVKCAGRNRDGALGNGATSDEVAASSVDVVGLSAGVLKVAAGGWHSCALTAAGGVKCWGRNTSGQLGDGSVISKSTPVDVVGLQSGVSSVVAGTHHTCALMTGGDAKCWGDNSNGQLGNGQTANGSRPLVTPTPVDVVGASGLSQLSASWTSTCALTSGGAALCWGRNDQGQLGDGTLTGRSSPVAVATLGSGVSGLAVAQFHTCAMTTGGAVKCWGLGGYLGNDNTISSSVPVDAGGLTSGVTQLVSGDRHTCAMVANGVVKCWGLNMLAALGQSSSIFSERTPKDVPLNWQRAQPPRPQATWQEFFAVDYRETPYVGDFDGDLRTDVITFTRQNPTAVGDAYVALSDGAKFGANTKWHDFFAISTDETVVIGDYNGDGKDDIATWLGKGTRQVFVALSTGTGMTMETVWINSIGVNTTDYLASGDANGDGKADLILFARTQGKAYVALSNGTQFGTPTIWHPFFAVSTFERPRVADVNGDGKADIVTFATDSPTANGDVYVALSNGTAFRAMDGSPNSDKWHDFFTIRQTEEIRIGDLNADGKDDFFTFLPPPFGQAYTVLSRGNAMAANILWPEIVVPALGAGDTVYVGDVNADGKADIIVFAQGEGKVYVSLAS